MFKKIIIGIVGCSMLLFIYLYTNNNQFGPNWDIVKHIIEKTDAHGNLIDYDNEFAVNSKDDVSFSFNKGKLTVYFGKVALKLGESDLSDEEFMNALERIGITVSKNKNGRYVVKYKGEEVDRWVN